MPNEQIELTLDAVASGGDAVGRHPENGKIVFVADAIPGERVLVTIIDDHARWQRGRLRQVIEASPDRVMPPCPYFGPPQPVTLPDGTVLNPDGEPRCAGCLWQHVAYERQLTLKQEIVVDQLSRLAELDNDRDKARRMAAELVQDPIALGDPEDETRLLTQGHMLQMSFLFNQHGQLALPVRDGSDSSQLLLPIEECLLQHPQLADLFQAFRVDEETGSMLVEDLSGVELSVGATADEIASDHEGMVVLQSREGNAPSLEMDLPVNVLLQRPTGGSTASTGLLIGEWSYPVQLADRTLTAYPAMGGSPMLWPHVIGSEAVGVVTAQVLEIMPFEHIVHVGAGAGLTTLTLAQEAQTVIAVEDHELAVAALQSNCASADNVDIQRGKLDAILKYIRVKGYESDAVVWSPWQAAPDAEMARQFALLGVKRMALIMDDGDELARFVPVLAQHGFKLSTIQPIDLQPHQETVVLVARFDRALI